jgi:hypothetical protein
MQAVSTLNATQEPRAKKKSYPDLVKRFLETGSDRNVVPLSREFFRFTGSLEGALFLAQLLYWHPRTNNPRGWIYKTDADWSAELCLSKHAVREARLRFEHMGIVQTKLKRANGSPTTHYRCDMARLKELWDQFLNTSAGEWAQALESFKEELKAVKNARKGTRKRPTS